MTEKLIIVSGMYGSGKTTYCNRFNYPLIHVDDVYDYDAKHMKYELVEDWININNKAEILMLDAYLFGTDKDLSKLRKAISPISNIGVVMVYTTLHELYECQRSTSGRRDGIKERNLSEEKDMWFRKKDQRELMEVFTEHLEVGSVSSVEYIFREGNKYTTADKEHLSEILKEAIL